jgi:hypothetical protein
MKYSFRFGLNSRHWLVSDRVHINDRIVPDQRCEILTTDSLAVCKIRVVLSEVEDSAR